MTASLFEFDGKLMRAVEVGNLMGASEARALRYLRAGVDGKKAWREHEKNIHNIMLEAAARGGRNGRGAKKARRENVYWFCNKQRTTAEIAKKMNCSHHTVTRRCGGPDGAKTIKQWNAKAAEAKARLFGGTRRGGKNSAHSSLLPGEFKS